MFHGIAVLSGSLISVRRTTGRSLDEKVQQQTDWLRLPRPMLSQHAQRDHTAPHRKPI
ncbi:hypothetical protein chiPu_0027988, partial [Chiloscyllium punctatum]|nr:hypothetical protein [Chiloscyllium punctatum]